VVGNGFIGRLFGAVLARRGDTVFAVDRNPLRAGAPPDGPVDAAVLCAPGGIEAAVEAVEPGGTVLVFADPRAVPGDVVYRRELTVVGSRSSTRAFMEEAVALLPELEVPEPVVLPFAEVERALALFREGSASKVVLVP